MFERIVSAIPLLARHANAYCDLIADDAATARAVLSRRLWAGVVLVVATTLALASVSTWLIALGWNTAARLWIIGAVAGFFLLIALSAAFAMTLMREKSAGLFAKARLEWAKDCRLIDDLVAKTSPRAH